MSWVDYGYMWQTNYSPARISWNGKLRYEIDSHCCQNVFYVFYTMSGSLFILIYFSLIVKQALFTYINLAWIWSSLPRNQPVLSNKGKVSCSRKQHVPKIHSAQTHDNWSGLNSWLTGTHRLRVRCANDCPTWPSV